MGGNKGGLVEKAREVSFLVLGQEFLEVALDVYIIGTTFTSARLSMFPAHPLGLNRHGAAHPCTLHLLRPLARDIAP